MAAQPPIDMAPMGLNFIIGVDTVPLLTAVTNEIAVPIPPTPLPIPGGPFIKAPAGHSAIPNAIFTMTSPTGVTRYRMVRHLGAGAFGGVGHAIEITEDGVEIPNTDVAIKCQTDNTPNGITGVLTEAIVHALACSGPLGDGVVRLLKIAKGPSHARGCESNIYFILEKKANTFHNLAIRSPELFDIRPGVKRIANTLRTGQRSFTLYHSDLKPDNILVDEAGCVSLSDFGLSQATYNGITYTASPDRYSGELDHGNASRDFTYLCMYIKGGGFSIITEQSQKFVNDLLEGYECNEGGSLLHNWGNICNGFTAQGGGPGPTFISRENYNTRGVPSAVIRTLRDVIDTCGPARGGRKKSIGTYKHEERRSRRRRRTYKNPARHRAYRKASRSRQ